jgi:hypothetical protein
VRRNCLSIAVVRTSGICKAASRRGVGVAIHWNRSSFRGRMAVSTNERLSSSRQHVEPGIELPGRVELPQAAASGVLVDLALARHIFEQDRQALRGVCAQRCPAGRRRSSRKNADNSERFLNPDLR